MNNEKKYNEKWRIPAGLFIFFIIWVMSVALMGFLPFFGMILGAIFLILFYLYMFGVLGLWLMDFDILGAVNTALKLFGTITGTIGFFLRPFPIIVYGSNKKWILNLFAAVITVTAVLLTVVQVLTDKIILFGIFNYFSSAVTVIYALFIVFAVKKCPRCKRVMNLIDFGNVDYGKTKYYKDRSENIGYVSDGQGGTIDVYANVRYEYEGMDNTFAKEYTCGNCGQVKYGKKFKAVTKI